MPISTRQVCVAAACLNQTPLDWDNNRNHIVAAIREARSQGVHFLCCPELCITGYGCEDSFLSVSNCQMALNMLMDILPETKNLTVALGLPILYRDGLYNSVCLIVDTKIVGFVAKQYLAGDGIHYEPRWFKPWPPGLVADITIQKENYPIGDLVFDINDLRLGFEICEDAWVAKRTGIQLANRGVDILFNPSASHFAFGKSKIRKRFVQEGARAFGVGYVYANLVGNEAGRIIYDGDTIIAAGDRILASGPRFSFQDVCVTKAILDIEDLRIDRATSANYPKVIDDNAGIVKCQMKMIEIKEIVSKEIGNKDIPEEHDWEQDRNIKNQEFSRAVALGLFDYMRKSRSRGFVLNLSGGVDSTCCACLVLVMLHLSLRALGQEKFKKKLAYFFDGIKSAKNKNLLPQALLPEFLFCLYQRTSNSSNTTETAASDLAQAFGFSYADIDIDPVIEQYVNLIEGILGRSLTWDQDDLPLQNIQSRARAPSAWLLANIRNALFLSASNRSEAAVGYGTMDGDISGGLAPIAGVNKTFLMEWLKWLELGGMNEIGSLPILEKVTRQRPSAELRPYSKEKPQTDEDDLMPYPWLDMIARLFVRDKRSPQHILVQIRKQFPDAKEEELKSSIKQFFQLWSRNQWKRERMPPSFHLDDESLDPKTWCRFPILSGGFLKELEEL